MVDSLGESHFRQRKSVLTRDWSRNRRLTQRKARLSAGFEGGPQGSSFLLRDCLLEPVVGERFVVEGRHFDPPGRRVEGEGLRKNGAGLEARNLSATRTRARLERLQQAAPEPESAGARRYPHALDLRGHIGVMLDGTAADCLALGVHDDELPGRRTDLVRERGRANRRVETAWRPPVELRDVLCEAVSNIRTLRIDGPDLQTRDDEQALNLAHRHHQTLTLF